LGNADTWYSNAAAHGVPVNSTPANGSVAWWDDAPWNGDAGHVAYVESVNADGSITVSEDAYPSGPFDWRTITPGSSSWPGGFIHFKDLTGGGSTATSYLITRVGATVYGKQSLTDTWSTLTAGTAADVQAAGTRIAFLDNTGTLWAKDGLGGTWYQEIGSVSQFVLTPEYLIARVGDTVYAKAGLTDTWSTLTTGAVDVKAAGTRIAVLDGNGNLLVKDTIGGTWFDETSGASQYVVTSSYLLVRQGTTISGKQGLSDSWTTLTAGSATDMQAAGTRIAFLDNSGTLWAKDGLGGTWYQETSPVSQYVVTPDLLLVRVDSTIYGKQNLGDTWSTLTAGTATDVTAAGTRIAFEDGSDTVFAKDGLNGTWYQEIGSASQYITTTTEPQ
jgi:surface antigen